MKVKNLNKALALVMALVMMFGILPLNAWAANFTYSITDVPANGDNLGMISGGTISGETGSVASHSWDGTTLTVVLTSDTPDNAVISSSWTKTGNKSSISGAGNVTLSKGEGSQTIVLTLMGFVELSRITVKYVKATNTENQVPVLADGQNATFSGETTAKTTYNIDLSGVFTDPDDDSLAYQVKIDDGDYTDFSGSNYAYEASIAGEHTLVFRAYDGTAYSDDTYTVNLNVKNSNKTYNVNVTVPDETSVKFYAVNKISGNTAIKGDALVYENGVVKVPENVTRIIWDANDVIGMSAPVSYGMSLELVAVAFNAKLDSGEADASAAVVITDKEGVNVSGTAANTYLLPAISGFTYKLTPSSAYSKSHNSAELTEQTPASGSVDVTFESKHFTVIAPKGSVVSAGTLSTYYIYSFKEPISIKTEGSNVIYKFAPLSGSAFVRVQRPDDEDAVTYWDWSSSKAEGKTITITEAMLFMNDGNSFNSDTIYHNFEQNSVDVADVYLNVNEKGYINLEVGENFTFNIFRNWHIVESWANSKASLPDVTYTVIDENGNKSDVVSVTPNENNSSVATLIANKKGTALVLVSYDALYTDSDLGNKYRFSAIWPENTGVLVVSVGADGSSVVTNMTINDGKNSNTVISKAVGDKLDAEHDVLYYVGTQGASYSFTPEKGCKVSVARAILTKNSLTYKGFTTDNVDVDEETGEVTISGLTAGSHVIKVEKNNVATYQVIRAKQTSYTITDSEGNEVTAETRVLPGTQLTIQFGDLYNPINKLSGIYNTNCRVYCKGEDGTEFRGSSGSEYGYYTFAADAKLHKVTITIPSDWSEATYTISGCLQTGGFGDAAGKHRGATYATGKPANITANSTSAYLGELPEIVLNIDIPATSVALDKTSLELSCKNTAALTATVEPENATDSRTWESSNEDVVTVDENGNVTAVAPGEAKITITVGNFSAECNITVSHNFVETPNETCLKDAASCTEKAVYYKSCACGEIEEETFEYGDALGHYLEHHERKDATTTSEGSIEYWFCTRCEKYYNSQRADDESEIEYEDIVIPKLTENTPKTGDSLDVVTYMAALVIAAMVLVVVVYKKRSYNK